MPFVWIILVVVDFSGVHFLVATLVGMRQSVIVAVVPVLVCIAVRQFSGHVALSSSIVCVVASSVHSCNITGGVPVSDFGFDIHTPLWGGWMVSCIGLSWYRRVLSSSGWGLKPYYWPLFSGGLCWFSLLVFLGSVSCGRSFSIGLSMIWGFVLWSDV